MPSLEAQDADGAAQRRPGPLLWPTPRQRESTTRPTMQGLLRAASRFPRLPSSLPATACWAEADCRATRTQATAERPMVDRPTTPTTRRMLNRHSGQATRASPWLTLLERRTLSYGRNHHRAYNTGLHLQGAPQRLLAKRAHLRALSGARLCCAAGCSFRFRWRMTRAKHLEILGCLFDTSGACAGPGC